MAAGAWAAIVAASVGAVTVVSPVAGDSPVVHPTGLATRKGGAEPPPPLLATLAQIHTGECVAVDALGPTEERFTALLADRTTGEVVPLDGRLLGLLRAVSALHPLARIELVSGFRSWKFNERLRKKGHHVASHSQHSLGHAVDFRIVPADSKEPLDPRAVEAELHSLGWEGGIGVYTGKGDEFVHADVGRSRGWSG